MRRAARLCLLVALLSCGAAFGHKVQLQTGGTVLFAPTAADYLNGFACTPAACLEPIPVSPAVSLKVLRQARGTYTLSVRHEGLPPDTDLYARYVVDPNQSASYTTAWLTLDSLPGEILSSDDPNTRVGVEYQLRLGAAVVEGTYRTKVTYSVAGSSVSHDLEIGVEPVIALRINGTVAGAAATLYFDYSDDLLAYVQAVTGGAPLQLTSTELESVEVFTNNASGYTTTITLTQVSGPSTGSLDGGSVRLSGGSASGSVLSSSQPTQDFVKLVVPEDFALRVDGRETPGEYTFELTYQAEMNP